MCFYHEKKHLQKVCYTPALKERKKTFQQLHKSFLTLRCQWHRGVFFLHLRISLQNKMQKYFAYEYWISGTDGLELWKKRVKNNLVTLSFKETASREMCFKNSPASHCPATSCRLLGGYWVRIVDKVTWKSVDSHMELYVLCEAM